MNQFGRPVNVPAQSRYVLPQFEERTAYGFKRQDPYTKLFEDRIIFLGVQVDDASADDVMAQLLVLEASDPDGLITLYINSPGGSTTAMLAIYDTMQFLKPTISTYCMGQAASAAAVLLAAGTPGHRHVLAHSRVLLHQPSTQGSGTISDLALQAAEILRIREQTEAILSKHTGQSVERLRKDTDRDRIFTADDAISYGLADTLIEGN